jgi:hypothetical protein
MFADGHTAPRVVVTLLATQASVCPQYDQSLLFQIPHGSELLVNMKIADMVLGAKKMDVRSDCITGHNSLGTYVLVSSIPVATIIVELRTVTRISRDCSPAFCRRQKSHFYFDKFLVTLLSPHRRLAM